MAIRTLFNAAAVVLLMTGAQMASAQPVASMTGAESYRETVQHGGGCRKDSPPGQCCHAGSQPYHCH